MKVLFSLSLFFIFSISIFSQKKGVLSIKDQAIVEHFNNNYKKKNYKKFTGKIIAKDNKVQFDDKVIFYDKSDKIASLILTEGLIYPQLLTDYQMEKFMNDTTDKTQKRFLRLQKNPKATFDVNNVNFTDLTELGFLDTPAKSKRFKITCRDSKLGNSNIYIIELTNKHAEKNATIEDFIRNSTLTYLYQKTY
ncbi:hypothetical protein D1632_12115 [Chryseobacterium nematophagum]|uniref:Uncharacterized protein n=1 Tax=Chryseobacterium nematophagum TaxID=2305228 RepID=A0A3M7L8M7_9FLAO|nr:hypothetical protein [Chryseobacterium nematophagum]RMZ58365.1 hypothetical protein D1632_12115 [Chryseobacterium nematophagum]